MTSYHVYARASPACGILWCIAKTNMCEDLLILLTEIESICELEKKYIDDQSPNPEIHKLTQTSYISGSAISFSEQLLSQLNEQVKDQRRIRSSRAKDAGYPPQLSLHLGVVRNCLFNMLMGERCANIDKNSKVLSRRATLNASMMTEFRKLESDESYQLYRRSLK